MPAHIASASAERLKHYNKVLGEQPAELKAEIEGVEMRFCYDPTGSSPGAPPSTRASWAHGSSSTVGSCARN